MEQFEEIFIDCILLLDMNHSIREVAGSSNFGPGLVRRMYIQYGVPVSQVFLLAANAYGDCMQ